MPNYIFTVEEKVTMVKQHYQGLSYRRISDHFAATYPDRPIPSHASIRKIVLRFEQTGTVNGHLLKCSQPNRGLSSETKLAICLAAEEDPTKPASKIAEEIGVSKTTVRNVLREAK